MNISGKTIIITGAASGIGRALLTQLATYEATLIAVDIQSEQLEQISNTLSKQPATIVTFVGDMTQSTEIDSLLRFAQSQTSVVDIFIANAGFAYYEMLGTADWQHIDHIYHLNTISPIYSVLKMREINSARPYKVVITASAMAYWALPGYALYSGTKASLESFARAYRVELDDPSALTLVYPIATRTSFFEVAGKTEKRIAPTPFPSQTADYVAKQIIKGIERDQPNIHPSIAFRVAKFLNRFLPIEWINRQLETIRLKRWLDSEK